MMHDADRIIAHVKMTEVGWRPAIGDDGRAIGFDTDLIVAVEVEHDGQKFLYTYRKYGTKFPRVVTTWMVGPVDANYVLGKVRETDA